MDFYLKLKMVLSHLIVPKNRSKGKNGFINTNNIDAGCSWDFIDVLNLYANMLQ